MLKVSLRLAYIEKDYEKMKRKNVELRKEMI
jgi:hypothetical protein